VAAVELPMLLLLLVLLMLLLLLFAVGGAEDFVGVWKTLSDGGALRQNVILRLQNSRFASCGIEISEL